MPDLTAKGRSSATEVDAYAYIRERLKDSGWNIKNPSRHPMGQVWTQNQCLSDPGIRERLGAKRPENIIKISETKLWVIEAKANRKDLELALSEAVDYYSERINECGPYRAIIASGVAGNEDTGLYLVKNKIRIDGVWHTVTINRQDATSLLSPKDVATLLSQNTSDISDFAPPQKLFLKSAERINEILHMGGINKNQRAEVMAALLLSVIQEPQPNLDNDLDVLIDEINSRARNILRSNNKAEFARFVEIKQPTNNDNHVKFKNALVRTIQELRNLNIRSAMNSNTDILGLFYEVFLKYGNGAKEIGIILTPRHITRFAVDIIGLTSRDIVLDLTCGTGGFLVAAYDYARREFTEGELNRFRKQSLYGIEQQASVAVLAIVNMIFRGDGKNNIIEGNCFTTYLEARTKDGKPSARYIKEPPIQGNEAVTRVLMNPPFALKDDADKEYLFVSHALNLMADGGLLFSLLPMNAMFGDVQEKLWRSHDLLGKHTLLSVVSFPSELFYPSALKQVVGIVVKKGTPHPKDHPVFWACVTKDGYIKIKSKRLPANELEPPKNEPNQLNEIKKNLTAFIAQPRAIEVNIPELCKTAPIDFGDPLLELLPEAYVDSRIPSNEMISAEAEKLARETAAFLVRYAKEVGVDNFGGH